MSVGTIYDSTTGRVLRIVSGMDDESLTAQLAPAEGILLGVICNDETQYVDGGVAIRDKGQLPEIAPLAVPADGVSIAAVTGLPNPTRVMVSGACVDDFMVTDGVLELTFDHPGKYSVQLDAGPRYMRSRHEIDAT